MRLWETLSCSFLLGQKFLDGKTDNLRLTKRYFLSSWDLSSLGLAALFFLMPSNSFYLIFCCLCVRVCVLSSFSVSLGGNIDLTEANIFSQSYSNKIDPSCHPTYYKIHSSFSHILPPIILLGIFMVYPNWQS